MGNSNSRESIMDHIKTGCLVSPFFERVNLWLAETVHGPDGSTHRMCVCIRAIASTRRPRFPPQWARAGPSRRPASYYRRCVERPPWWRRRYSSMRIDLYSCTSTPRPRLGDAFRTTLEPLARQPHAHRLVPHTSPTCKCRRSVLMGASGDGLDLRLPLHTLCVTWGKPLRPLRMRYSTRSTLPWSVAWALGVDTSSPSSRRPREAREEFTTGCASDWFYAECERPSLNQNGDYDLGACGFGCTVGLLVATMVALGVAL